MKLNYDLKKGMTVKIRDENISVFDINSNKIYCQFNNGYWFKQEYNNKGNQTYYENSNSDWCKREYDNEGNQTYFKNSYGDWAKREYNNEGDEIYYENNNGKIIDNRPKVKLTKEEYEFVKHFKRVEYIIKGDGYLHFYEGDWDRLNVFKLDDLDLKFDSLEQEIEYKADELEVK